MNVIGFNNIDEALEHMAAADAEAYRRLLPTHHAMLRDTERTLYWMRVYRDLDGMIEIWGESPSLESLASTERELGASEEESRSFMEREVLNRQRGYLRCVAYSVIVPEGEYGSVHASEVMPVPHEAFIRARALGWCAGKDLDTQRLMRSTVVAMDAELSAWKLADRT